MVQIEYCAEEGDDREDDDHASYHLINNKDAVGIKLSPHLVDEPGETEPPEQGSEDDAEIAHTHFDRHIRHHEGKLGKGGHEEEDDERIAQRYQESRDGIVGKGTLLVAALVHVLGRIALECRCKLHRHPLRNHTIAPCSRFAEYKGCPPDPSEPRQSHR